MNTYQKRERPDFNGKREGGRDFNNNARRQGGRNFTGGKRQGGRDFKNVKRQGGRDFKNVKRQGGRDFKNQRRQGGRNFSNERRQRPNFNNGKKYQGESNDRQQQFKTKRITKDQAPTPNTSVQHLPTIQQLLALPKQQRLNRSTAIFEQVRPFLTSFMQKKQGSRVTQLLFKWGNPATKTYIYKEIIKSWKELIKSTYALYIIAKVSKEFELPGLLEELEVLQNNREGAQILENFILSSPEAEAAKKLKARIIELQQQAKTSNELKAQQTLDNMALRSIEKQYYWFQLSKLILRLRLPTMFEQEKQKAVELLSENVASIVNDEEGVRLFIELLNNCSAKEKKNIVKQYKGHIDEIVKANNVSYVSLIKLMIETDDTVLTVKSFEEELIQLIPQILTCKKAFSIIFSLLCPRNNNFNILGKYEPHVTHTTCKKPEQQRKKQLRQDLYDPIVEFLKNEDNLNAIIKNPVESKLIVGLEKSMQEDHHALYQPFVTLILQHFLKIAKQSLQANTFQDSILSDGNGSKVLKSLLLIQADFVEFYCEELAKLFIKHIKTVLESRASFILLGILEKGGRDHLVREIVKSGAKFDKCIAGQHFVKLIDSLGGQSKPKDGKKK